MSCEIEDILVAMAVCDVINLRRTADAYGCSGDKLLSVLIKALETLRRESAIEIIDESWLEEI